VPKTGQAVEKVAVGPVYGLKPGSQRSKTGLLILKTSLRNATKEFFNRLFLIQPKKLALRVYCRFYGLEVPLFSELLAQHRLG